MGTAAEDHTEYTLRWLTKVGQQKIGKNCGTVVQRLELSPHSKKVVVLIPGHLFPQFKDMDVRLTGNSKLSVGVSLTCGSGWLSRVYALR